MKFRFVDRITAWSPWERIQGVKAVSFEEYQLKEAFGDEARLPETLLLESFFQLGNWLILLSSGFQQAGCVVRLGEARFHDALRPGEVACLDVTVTRRHEEGIEFAGKGRAGDRVIITGVGCLATTVSAADWFDPDDLRVLFEDIGPPPEAEPERAGKPQMDTDEHRFRKENEFRSGQSELPGSGVPKERRRS
jgi:3-hydroxymyristoyl/3-hydroxydecanoyl-(acyl carrier protein) dehydratase